MESVVGTLHGHLLGADGRRAVAPGLGKDRWDVLFGDVFLCGGQSNMEFPLANGFNVSSAAYAQLAKQGGAMAAVRSPDP